MSQSWKTIRLPRAEKIHFDFDDYLCKYLPSSQLHRLPGWTSRWLGYRKKPSPEVGNVVVAFWSLVGAFTGLVVIGAVWKYSEALHKHGNPSLVFASMGAAAVLEYNSIHAPLAQPRNAVLGHTLSAIVGVAVSKLFQLNSDFESLRWVGGALACGIASAVMTLTNTVHPPGGATAVLAVTDVAVEAIGWFFVPVVLLACVLMLLVALLLNNVQRRYPLYWWTPRETGLRYTKGLPPDLETLGSSDKTFSNSIDYGQAPSIGKQSIVVNPGGIFVAEDFALHEDEIIMLKNLAARLGFDSVESALPFGERGEHVYNVPRRYTTTSQISHISKPSQADSVSPDSKPG